MRANLDSSGRKYPRTSVLGLRLAGLATVFARRLGRAGCPGLPRERRRRGTKSESARPVLLEAKPILRFHWVVPTLACVATKPAGIQNRHLRSATPLRYWTCVSAISNKRSSEGEAPGSRPRGSALQSHLLTVIDGPLGTPPKGFVHDVSRSEIGRGLHAFVAAREAFQRWEQFDLGGFRS